MALPLAVGACDRLSHQVCDDGVLVLASEEGIEGLFHLVRDLELDGGHGVCSLDWVVLRLPPQVDRQTENINWQQSFHLGAAPASAACLAYAWAGLDVASSSVFTTLGALYGELPHVYRFSASLPEGPLLEFQVKVKDLPNTIEAERLVVQRIGQNIFRARLIDYWQGRCPLTGITDSELLRASHIIPCSDCTSIGCSARSRVRIQTSMRCRCRMTRSMTQKRAKHDSAGEHGGGLCGVAVDEYSPDSRKSDKRWLQDSA